MRVTVSCQLQAVYSCRRFSSLFRGGQARSPSLIEEGHVSKKDFLSQESRSSCLFGFSNCFLNSYKAFEFC